MAICGQMAPPVFDGSLKTRISKGIPLTPAGLTAMSPDSSALSRRQVLLRGAAAWSAAAFAALNANIRALAAAEASAAEPAKPRSFWSPFASLRELEKIAPAQMTPEAWEFINGGAGDENTIRWNVEAYQALRLRARMLVDVTKLDTRVKLFGRELPHPILLSPASDHNLVHPEAEVATAKGAGGAQATMVVSTFASKPIEEISHAATQPLWHATYVQPDRSRTLDLLHRAEAAGFEAICVPVDSPVVGARDREHHTYRFKDHGPVSFANRPANYWRYPTTWSDLEWFRSQTKLPLIPKGILTAEDAEQAIKAGASAIFVSNHGGRNLDTLPATIEVLPEIAQKVAGRVPLLIDGGIRRGTDVLKALSLGATAVSVGRPYLYGLAVNGADGVSAVVNILRNELEMALALVGRPSIGQLDKSVIWSKSE